jgi:hypothetical protein
VQSSASALPLASLPAWRGLDGLRTAVAWLAGATATAALVSIGAHIARLSTINPLGSDEAVGSRPDGVNPVIGIVTAVLAVLMLAILVCFIVWLWRAAKNNEALGRDHPRLGPEWAIAGWFLPAANLAMPVLVVQDLWRGSSAAIARHDPRWRIADRSALVGWWWATLLVALLWVSSGAGGTMSTSSASTVRTADGLAIVGLLALVAAGVLVFLVMREIGRRQQATRAAQESTSVGAAA